MTALAALSGLLLALGLVLVVAGMVPSRAATLPTTSGVPWAHRWSSLTRRPDGRAGRRRDLRLVAALAAGTTGYAMTGWLVWLLIVPVVVFVLPSLLADPPAPAIDQLAALDRWVHGLVATMPTGQSIADAIRTSRRTAPALLAPHLEQVVRRLDQQWSVRDALREMADRLGTPEADAVLAALGLAAHRGGTGATAILTSLSTTIERTLAAHREIEAERAKPRIVVRQVTAITVGMLGIAFLFGRDFFSPYATPLGQALLFGLVAAYLASLALMRRLTRPRARQRILAGGAR